MNEQKLQIKLGNEPGAPVIDLGTVRKGRAEKRLKEEYLPFYPDAHIVSGETPVQPVAIVAEQLGGN